MMYCKWHCWLLLSRRHKRARSRVGPHHSKSGTSMMRRSNTQQRPRGPGQRRSITKRQNEVKIPRTGVTGVRTFLSRLSNSRNDQQHLVCHFNHRNLLLYASLSSKSFHLKNFHCLTVCQNMSPRLQFFFFWNCYKVLLCVKCTNDHLKPQIPKVDLKWVMEFYISFYLMPLRCLSLLLNLRQVSKGNKISNWQIVCVHLETLYWGPNSYHF